MTVEKDIDVVEVAVDRRKMLARLGLAVGVAYVAPAFMTLSAAHASGGSGASGASGGSAGSDTSDASEASDASDASDASGPVDEPPLDCINPDGTACEPDPTTPPTTTP